MDKYDPFKQTSEDLSTYWGRIRYFQNIITPMNLLCSKKTLLEYDKILSDIKDNKPLSKQYTDKELWKMRYLVDSSIHPQTKEVIPMPFRTSSYVPTNVPLMVVLALLPPTVKFFNQIIGQTLNQTYNFLFNYCNRNASNVYSNQQLALSYFGAVFFALVGSLGTIRVLQKMNAPSPLLRVGPILGVLAANSFNLFFTRTQDIFNGIDLYDNETNQVLPGKSIQAGRLAFAYTLAVRTATTLLLFGIPPLIISLFANTAFYKRPAGKFTTDMTITALNIYFGLSAAISLYPQYVRKDVKTLEPIFHDLRNAQNKKIDVIYFNKGL